jgi:GH35 family endo-1,4-beta-xylanase
LHQAKTANLLAHQAHRDAIQAWAVGSNDSWLQEAVQAADKAAQEADVAEQQASEAQSAAKSAFNQYKNQGNTGAYGRV